VATPSAPLGTGIFWLIGQLLGLLKACCARATMVGTRTAHAATVSALFRRARCLCAGMAWLMTGKSANAPKEATRAATFVATADLSLGWSVTRKVQMRWMPHVVKTMGSIRQSEHRVQPGTASTVIVPKVNAKKLPTVLS